MPVPFLDLKLQYQAIKSAVDAALERVVTAQAFILGPEVEGLEREIAEYLGVSHAVGVASGTDALLLPLKALELQPGDEVIVPAFTFFATAGAVWNAGLRPVFCDVDPETFNVTAETIEAAWTERTRVVVPVHLFGQMAPMEEILSLARKKGAFVLEDAAQAIGARQKQGKMAEVVSGSPASVQEDEAEWVFAGAAGDACAFSFFPTKNLGGFGDGGMVTTNDGRLAEVVRKLRVHGGLQMYHHERVGTNSRLDALQAAVLRAKLPYLDGWAEARRRNAALYNELLADLEEIRTPKVLEGNYHVYNQYTIRAQRRDELRASLSERGIGTGLYYPLGLHLQECFASLGGKRGSLPVTERLTEEVLSLPIFPELTEDQLVQVATAIRQFYEG